MNGLLERWCSKLKVIAIVQARMGSTRMPGKVIADIHGRPMLSWLLDRVKSVKSLDEIVIATTQNIEDDVLEVFARANKIQCFRGSEEDVLGRYFHCAKKYAAEIIVRITADDPLKDPGIISQSIEIVRDHPSVDYCSNTIEPTYPEGLDIEVFRYGALLRAYREAELPSEREHVTPYIWKNPHQFCIRSMVFERDLSQWRWTVDKLEDLVFIKAIYHEFRDSPLVPFMEIINFIEKNPELLAINTFRTVRNEGYLGSTSKERSC